MNKEAIKSILEAATLNEERHEKIKKQQEKIKKQKKEYEERNREKRNQRANEKIKCECGAYITRATKSRHMKTKKHREE